MLPIPKFITGESLVNKLLLQSLLTLYTVRAVSFPNGKDDVCNSLARKQILTFSISACYSTAYLGRIMHRYLCYFCL